MDFDNAKENIQPLAAGRNASILQAALQADSQHELQQQRRQYEEAIKNYEGDDLLEPWFEYIYWIEQSFPSGGKESGLEEVLLKCLTKFEKDKRYHQDRRMIKLYIKYIDTHENPQECYQQLYNQGIGTMVADLYICWAYYYDLSGNFPKADQIFKRGIDCHAEPFEELQEAHQHFGFTMSQRILYVDDTSKQKYQSTLIEKRQALTSLKSHRKKVGSIRTGAAIKSFAPGKVQVNSKNPSCSSRNISISVFEDENQDPNAIPPPEPCAEQSVVKTILDSARKQENVKEPGPWNKAHDKKQGKLFASENRTDLGFEILEDDEDFVPIKGKVKYGQPFIFFGGFVSRNKPQEEWNLPVTLENELIPRSYPSYDKCLLYPQPNMEYSLEELGCYYWCKRKSIENSFTQKYDTVWKSSIEKGVRMYPNFAKKNILLPEELTTPFDPMETLVTGKSKLVFDPKLCYPSENEQELQFEEVMYHRWKCGERKLKYGGNETIAITEEMEETICLPKEAARRKSFFPTRKSVAPSQFSRFSNVEETNEEDEEAAPIPSISTARRSVIMKTPKKMDRTEPIQTNESEMDNDAFAFKTPAAPPVKQKQLNFQIYEEEESNYEGNETCSTQVFNCFLRAQSVSTPKAVTKAKSSLADRQPMQLNYSGLENATPAIPNPTPVFSPPEYNDAGLTLQCKQLSTIMETSEQATGHTASTKSSINSADFEVEAHQSKMPTVQNVCATNSPAQEETPALLIKSLSLDDVLPTVRQHMDLYRLDQQEDTVPNLPAVKMFEDKTETVQKILICKAGNFSRLENKEDTAPSIKPVRFHEDKTETITKMVLAPKTPLPCEIPADDDMLELFAKSPVKGVTVENIFNSPLPPAAPVVANKSIFSASAFMNFRDSPDAKVKCNYDSPEVRAKCQSITGVKKLSNLSLLPCFDDTMETNAEDKKKTSKPTEFSFLTGIPSQIRGQEKGKSFLQEERRHQSKNDSVLPGFLGDQLAGDVQTKQRSKEDSFLSGFPSVTVGSNKPREDSFMSYLSNVGATKVKQGIEDSFLKKFSSSSDQMNSTESFMKFSTSIADDSRTKRSASTRDTFMQSFKVPGSGDKMDSTMSRGIDNSFLPNLSITDGPLKHKIDTENSFMPNLSKNKEPLLRQKALGGDSFLSNLSVTGNQTQQRITGDSFMPNLSIKENPSIQKGTESFMTNPSENSEAVSFAKTTQKLTDNIPMEDLSTKETSKTTNKRLQKPKIVSILTMKPPEDSFKLDLSTSSISCKIPACSKNPSIVDKSSKLPQMNQSDCSMSFLNSFSAPEPIKQPKHGEKFSIFIDSNCQQSPPPAAANQDKKFTIFEDSACKKSSTSTNKTSSFDASLKPDDFFEDNIRTEAFQANLSMIKNSTWLPNHFPRQSQIKEQSLNIKEESISGNEKSSGLSIFSSVPQDKSCEIMPPPPTLSRPNESNKFTNKPTPQSVQSSPPQPTDCIEIAESDEEEDFGKSIYYTKTPKTPNIVRHVWSPDIDQTPIQNYFVHPHAELDQSQQVIDDYTLEKDVNPFNRELTNAFLHQIDFTNYIEKLPTCDMVRKIQPLRKDCTITINDVSFNVLKLVGEGSFGAVYCAKEPHSGRMFALKQERPANLWEYYICLELQCRLKSNEILAGFINIDYALIGNNAGVLVSQFSRYGSLITVCNKIKKGTLKNVDEYVVMHMTSQLLLIMDHLHAANIIHADIKADNFLLMEKLVYGRKQPSIQLIDFGNAIDMSLLKKGQTFMFSQQEECFKCVEMREKRPWTFQLDLYGLAGVIHVLLFGKYMEISKKLAGWTHQTHIPRYFKKSLWNTIFHSLLNIDDCQTMPNLQNLRAQLEEEIAENDKSVCQKIVEFNRALDM